MDGVAPKNERVDEKADHARRLLLLLPATDRRRRLLHAAIVRRDEVLLDGLLAELLGSKP